MPYAFHYLRLRHGRLIHLRNFLFPESLYSRLVQTGANFIFQRYFISSQYYQDDGPVFLMLGGEAEANPQWMVQGQWINYASSYNALLLMLEHRFYGKSRPTR